MKDFAAKADKTSTLTAAEFNNYINELENAVTTAGLTLDSPLDIVVQLARSMSIYAAQADFYLDTGVADAYVVDPLGSFEAPEAYADGMRVRFVPDNANTGASTIDVNGLGLKDIKKTGGTVSLTGGDLPAARLVEIAFLAGPNAFTIVSVS